MELINILVLDDREENVIALEALLERQGVNIIGTTDPNEALRLSWEENIAIAIVDVQMPGMDGFEFAEILKGNPRTKHIFIIFATAYSKEIKHAVRGLNIGAVDYLYKPLDPFVTSAKVDVFIQLVRYQKEINEKNTALRTYQIELIRAKEEAEQGQKTKEKFLENLSHEIITPIKKILEIANHFGETLLTKEQKEIANLLQVSSGLLFNMIKDVLDFSKCDAEEFKINRREIDLHRNCSSVINLMNIRAMEKGLELNLILDPQLPVYIIADSLRLNQILMNLISNAIKFTLNGSVSLKVDVLDRDESRVRIRFAVSDTGIGIAKENLVRIFEDFEQADAATSASFGGTGLGLAIVKTLARLKEGTLEVDSEEKIGSTFCFINWYSPVQKIM